MHLENLTFENLADEVGLGKAVIIFGDRLGMLFFDNLYLHQMLEIYNADPGAAARNAVMSRLLSTAESDFELAIKICIHAPKRGPLKYKTLALLFKMAGNDFERLLKIYIASYDGLFKTEMDRLLGSAKTFDQWLKVCKYIPQKRDDALAKMRELAGSDFGRLLTVCKLSRRNDDARKTFAAAATLSQLLEIYDISERKMDRSASAEIEAEIKKLAGRDPEKWIEIYKEAVPGCGLFYESRDFLANLANQPSAP